MIGNKIADKITSASNKNSLKELPNNDETKEDIKMTTHKKRYISPEERQQNIDELELVPNNYWWFAIYKNGIPKNSEFVKQWIKWIV